MASNRLSTESKLYESSMFDLKSSINNNIDIQEYVKSIEILKNKCKNGVDFTRHVIDFGKGIYY